MYDPKTEELDLIPLCFRTMHDVFGNDKDQTLYGDNGADTGGVGWLDTRVWEETHDAAKAQGWCRPTIDGQFVPNASGYGTAFDPVDGSVWYASPGHQLPGKIFRFVRGPHPPQTCQWEVFEPPYHNAAYPNENGYTPRGIDVDSNGVVWTALAGNGVLASFDPRKCHWKSDDAAAISGQECLSAWTFYQPPGLKFKGENDAITDWFYLNWTDRNNTLGLGKDVQVVCGTGDNSLLVFVPNTKQWVTLAVPYPMGFYTRGVDGRIDDPNVGWKGRGLWTGNETRVMWHQEGGKGSTGEAAHFQVRPNPLAH
jgi:hypothetical protein